MDDDASPRPDRFPDLLARFRADRDCLTRLLPGPHSDARAERRRAFFAEWRGEIAAARDTGPLSRSDRFDAFLFAALLDAEERRLAREAERFEAAAPLLPFPADLVALDERRRRFEPVDAAGAAALLDRATARIAELRSELEGDDTKAAVAVPAARIATEIGDRLAGWHAFYHEYDPVFDWWVETPYRALETALKEYAVFLRETVAGAVGDAVVGEPLGRDALIAELRHAQVPYDPEELIAAGRREMAWCESEMRRAAAEMGVEDDDDGGATRAALERVKNLHAAPGGQPALVRDLAFEAIRYVEENDLVTVPPLARECWRMEMMSAERQKVSPFFLGGETIIVSFPTASMDHERKRMSLRGNNPAFARATVHHELIPGHHLQMFSMERSRPYRRLFWTPFWIEGWTLHWEMLLWEREFARTPEERVGMLFWRMHRGARVVFSLEYHLGQRTAAECIDLLVEEAGHERDNAVAEVRRSLEGDYGPLYQAAYLLGGWQMHALYGELVGSGRMTAREFHDAVMRENVMPIPTLRALLTGAPAPDPGESLPEWRFLG